MLFSSQESGLASRIGGHLQPLAEVPAPAAAMLLTAFVACFTEFASNTATIIIFLPVIAELVRPAHYPPAAGVHKAFHHFFNLD